MPVTDPVEALMRELKPERFLHQSREAIERDHLHIVEHHQKYLIPHLRRYITPDVQTVLDFGCGSGGSTIALALEFPGLEIIGTDVDNREIEIARCRRRCYGIDAKRCSFLFELANKRLAFWGNDFDLCICSSVLEYVTDPAARRFCVQEMVRLVKPGGLLFFSMPNRLYPFEIHTRKWGWNWFPRLMNARTLDCTWMEVEWLARPAKLSLYWTPVMQLLRHWSNFCLKKME